MTTLNSSFIKVVTILLALPVAISAVAGGVDLNEVSNSDYARFVAEAPQSKKLKKPKYWNEYRPEFFINSRAAALAPFGKESFTQPNHPVVGVSWYEATAYCRWRGSRLPTRVEWMSAAGGADDRIWPWGNQWDYKKANSGGERNGELDGYTYSAPVDSFAAGRSPFGLYNMAGNVAEWVAEQWVVGGSSNSSPSGVSIKAYIKREPDYRTFDIGFRCIAP